MSMSREIIIFIMLSLLLIPYICYLGFLQTTTTTWMTPYYKKEPEAINVIEDPNEFPIKFYYKYYVDLRYTPWRIRLFSMNPCLPKNFTILAIASYQNSSDILQFVGRHTEKTCPFDWDPKCFYNSFFFEVNITKIPDRLEVYVGQRRIKFEHFKIVRKEKKEGLTISVAPVYFYSHIHNIILFFEVWRAQGATKFLIFYHSGTQQTRKFFNYYQDLGILELIPWSGFGQLPEYIRHKHPEVASSVCRSGQTLAQNIAALEAETDLASSVDFDEIIVSENIIASNKVRQELKASKNVGAAYFLHYFVQFHPKIDDFDYGGVLNPVFLDKRKANKYIYNTSLVDNVDVHFVSSFIDNGHHLDVLNMTALLHYRINSYSDKSPKTKLNHKIFPENDTAHLKNMENDLVNIFGTKPKLNPKLNEDLEKCFANLEKIKECRSMVYFCKPAMMKGGELWDFESTPSSQIFL